MKKYSLFALFFVLVFVVACNKDETTTNTPVPAPFEGKFKYSKCYTYKLSKNGTYDLTTITTHNFNSLGKIVENIDSSFYNQASTGATGYKFIYFGNDSIQEVHSNFTYHHFLSSNRLNSTFIEGTWMLFTYNGSHMVKMVLPADQSNPEDVYNYGWDNNNNLIEVINNGRSWKNITYTDIVNENNDGEFWESGRHSMHHPLKSINNSNGTTTDYTYHITNDGFADTVYTTTTYLNPLGLVEKYKMVYVK